MNKRTFILGSEWLYVKLYSGPKTIEDIFVNEISPILYKLIENNDIDYFFFIRFQDPDYHIRLRLHFKDVKRIGNVLLSINCIFEKYMNSYIISRVIFDTYNREIERYSEDLIKDMEKLFALDSYFILSYLYNYECDDSLRWLVSIKYIDTFLNKCGLSLDEKIDLCRLSSDSLLKEIYNTSPQINKLLNNKYREFRTQITEILTLESSKKNSWILHLNNYLHNSEFITIKLYKSNPNFNILNSIIHMHINRMFRTKQRINECVIFYLLHKFYNSQKGLFKYKNNAKDE